MDVHASVEAPCADSQLFAVVDDLGGYPAWIDLVHAADRDGDDAEGPAWRVELRARVGPLARSKRLRMVRTVHRPDDGLVVFERRETDGRRHSPWVLRAEVVPSPHEQCVLHMHLHYGGSLWTGGVLERALADQIEASRGRLVSLLAPR
ncbi:MAG: SRPBCC family protein [Ilumatobacteraceae bacterium]